jgi:uncharacterized membrane protein YphA (DoxX/SURF4 family)
MAPEDTTRDRSAVDWALFVARAVVGVIFMAHGAQKLFGAFGGPGLSAVVQMMGRLTPFEDGQRGFEGPNEVNDRQGGLLCGSCNS